MMEDASIRISSVDLLCGFACANLYSAGPILYQFRTGAISEQIQVWGFVLSWNFYCNRGRLPPYSLVRPLKRTML